MHRDKYERMVIKMWDVVAIFIMLAVVGVYVAVRPKEKRTAWDDFTIGMPTDTEYLKSKLQEMEDNENEV